ncbi:MAG: ATP-binding protein [Oscillospiraceae bacterium]|nr:ATP-binding protein [Oscillospiraceae bacterium]
MENAAALVKIFAETISEKNPPQNGDYIEDDILYCGKCHTAKRRRLTFHGEEIIVPVMCECAARADEEQRRQSAAEQSNIRAAHLRRLSMMEGVYRSCTFDTAEKNEDNARSIKICERYAEKFPQMLRENRGLLLFGRVGTGKTFAAACIANELLKQGFSVVMTSLVMLVDGGADNLIARMPYIDMLILDDLGAERSTDYGLEKVYSVIDARYRSGKPAIYTTNLPLDTLKNGADIRYARIYDRVLERCFPVEFRGVSRRKREARRGFEEMTKLLIEEE